VRSQVCLARGRLQPLGPKAVQSTRAASVQPQRMTRASATCSRCSAAFCQRTGRCSSCVRFDRSSAGPARWPRIWPLLARRPGARGGRQAFLGGWLEYG